ncbi:fucose permease [Georgenia soli]|uniref:Fucose permease n=1 Tax=Georgenia soli TaxID=638953 RepID=A0A2A9EQC0_9MICO|nr:MFS transporter [Georgenia soli]PFG41098.1 fucose permease [Georgenia soli]
MAAPTGTAVTAQMRRARAAVSALFFLNAVLYANLVPRLPEVKEKLDLTNAALGTGIAAMPAGALLAGLLAPALINRLSSARVASFGLVGLALAVCAVPLSGSWWVFAAAMLVAGAFDALVDVAQNAHGFRVQRLYRRSIVNAFHGLWSVGAVAGGLLGSAAAGMHVPLGVHLAVSTVVFSVTAVVAYRFLLPGPEDAERVAGRSAEVGAGPADAHGPDGGDRPDGGHGAPVADSASHGPRRTATRTAVLLAALGLLAACEAFVQDAGSSWGALYLREEVGASAAAGGLAFVALQVAMVFGRFTGDRVINRYGQRRVVRTGGVLIALGMALALAVPSLPTTLAGFALAGLGVATLVPAVMHTADELPGLAPGVGLTVVGWLLRVGFLVSPTIIGLLADAISLRAALVSVALAGLVVLALGRVLETGAPQHAVLPHDASSADAAARTRTDG